MKPWNPYAMTFHGQPITGQTPPKLVVYGQPLTAQQGAMLQTAYNAFVGAARVSIVPNPTRQGRLLDGSPYTIECSQGVCTCTVWTTNALAALTEIFSGVLFIGELIVLVNKGKPGEPSGKWELKDVSGVYLSPGYLSNYFSGVSAPYSQSVKANVSVVLPGTTKRYIYNDGRGGIFVGRYGHIFAGVSGSGYPFAVGAAKNQKSLVVVCAYDNELKTGITIPNDTIKEFPAFGASQTFSELFVDEESLATLSSTRGYDPKYEFLPDSVAVNRSGSRLLFVERKSSELVSENDISGDWIPIEFAYRREAITTLAPDGQLGIHLAPPPFLGHRVKYKKVNNVVREASRAGDYFTAPQVIYEQPDDEINSKTLFSKYIDPERGCWSNGNESSVNVTSKSTPPVSRTFTLHTSDGSWQWRGSQTCIGQIDGRLNRKEKTHSVLPHYVGDALVLLRETREFDYTETCTGTVDYRNIDGRYGSGYGVPPPSSIYGDSAGPDSPRRTVNHRSQNIAVDFYRSTYITLNNGEKLFTRKISYTESSTAINRYERIDPESGPDEWPENSESREITYSANREDRVLLVYDPELDMLCYQEFVYTISRQYQYHVEFDVIGGATQVASVVASPGGDVHAPSETIRIVISCRGKQMVIERPFNQDDDGPSQLHPAVGIAPGIKANTSPYSSSGYGYNTAFPFASWPIELYGVSARGFQLAGSDAPGTVGYDVPNMEFRGLFPHLSIRAPLVRYEKTPETGAGYLRITLNGVYDHQYLVDGAGIKNFDDVFPGLIVGHSARAF